jgi:hypothetical protein
MRVIKFATVHENVPWGRQFPNQEKSWNGWRFLFNDSACDYDWLVVFDDLLAPISLKCEAKNTIHIAAEPPSVHRYSKKFLQQFTWILTQDPSVRHPGAIRSQSGLTWHIGWNRNPNASNQILRFEELKNLFDFPKTKLISMIASNKAFTLGHSTRLKFAEKLKKYYGEQLDLYGRGIKEIDDKELGLRDYRFSVVIENSSYDHYFTEKLTDCIISGCFPLYYGCPNLDRYLPAEAFVRIDVNDFESSVDKINEAISTNRDLEGRSALRLSRDLAMYKYNIFPMITELIMQLEENTAGARRSRIINSFNLFSLFRNDCPKVIYDQHTKRKSIFNLKHFKD